MLLEAAPDAIVGVGPDGTIALANAQAERLFGYQRDELVGQPIELLVPEQARAVHPGHRRRYLADARPRPMGAGMQLAGRRHDGTQFPAEISLSVVQSDRGPLVVAAVRDVSDRVRAEAKFRGLLEAAPDATVGVGPDGVIALVNAQAERLFGYRRDELVGQTIELLVPDAVRERHPGHRTRYLTDPAHRPMGGGMALAARRRDGTEFPCEISLSAIDTEDGVLVSAAVRDVTERQRAAEAVNRLASIVQSSHDAIMGKTLDGVITSWNPGAERLYGYFAQEIIGRHVGVLYPPDQQAVERDILAQIAAGKRVEQYRTHRVRKDGTSVTVSLNMSPIVDATGQIVGVDTEDGPVVSAAIRDVTDRLELQAERERLKSQAERERLEAQLHQAQRLESLGQLAGGVAHDFNNLLAVMLNYTTFIAEEIDDAHGADPAWQAVRHDIAQVRRAGERATELTHQLLAFGRREVVRPQVLNLNTVVAEVEALLRRTIGEHIQLHTTLPDDLWPVLADPGQLEQVLVNLAVNARDAMPDGGTLSICTANHTLDETTAAAAPDLGTGRYVKLRVADTGTGIPPEVAEHVFEPFFTTKPKGEGSGLGLATVYGIITQAGGHARIASSPGAGTAFTALLPATAEPAAPVAAAPATPAAAHHPGGEAVLIVEDEEALREVARRILSRNGYHVLTAASGTEALKAAEHAGSHLDLLLTDVIMPGMLGKELAAKIRDRYPDIQVLYMSGYAQPVLASQGTLDPGVTLVEKPFSETTLLDRIREVLDTHPS
ncbi:PAS domain S-box protein [Actinoplanes sp. NPDC051513]|uniref:PAS domain S-box protein n=1 Tax=Actinoplanes sp. NPDC051513 TaxID=3363908 RepID=UPI0037A41B07